MELKRESSHSPRRALWREITLTALFLAILIFVVLNSVRFFTRFDLTESKAYSISDVSRNLFEEIGEQVQITYYVSERLQERFPQPQGILDLLSEYAASSRGAIELTVVNPGAEGEDIDPEALGVVPQQLQVAEQGEQTLAVVYSGIVVSYLERFETIPFVFSTRTLEYEMTSTIRGLVTNRTKSVRFLIGDENLTLDSDYSFAASQLAEGYDVSDQPAEEPVPDGVDLLVVVGAEKLSQAGLDQVADYLDRGGAVLLAVESVRVMVDLGLVASPVEDSPVFAFLEGYGVNLASELVLDEAFNQIVIQESGRGFNVQRMLPYPHWVTVLDQYTSAEHPVTARFTGLDLYWPTYLTLADDSDGEIIAASTNRAWLMPEPFRTNPQEAALFQINAERSRGQYGFVAAVGSTAGDGGSSGAGGRMIVVTDADFLQDRLIQATQSGYNLAFLENSVQWLANDEDLLEIRTRAARDLRLNAIEDPERERAVILFAQTLNTYVVPALVIAVGLLRFIRRRRRASSRREQNS